MHEKGLNQYINSVVFYDIAKEYSVDPGFALATFIKETGWGKQGDAWLNKNNPAGITCGNDYCSYDSKTDGFVAMFELLQDYTSGSISYIGKKVTALEARSTWCETKDIDEILDLWKEIGE